MDTAGGEGGRGSQEKISLFMRMRHSIEIPKLKWGLFWIVAVPSMQ